jgi:hypothetical protein
VRKTPFFRRKFAKIAENCDHNIDPHNMYLSLTTLQNIFDEYSLRMPIAAQLVSNCKNQKCHFCTCLQGQLGELQVPYLCRPFGKDKRVGQLGLVVRRRCERVRLVRLTVSLSCPRLKWHSRLLSLSPCLGASLPHL